MANPSQPTPPPAGDDRNVVTVDESPIVPPFEERLRLFWEKNRGLIFGICLVALLAIVGRSGWELWQERRAVAEASDYAAATTTDQLKGFAAAHAEAPLGGLAALRVGDEAYAAGRYSEAIAAYEQAREPLAGTPFAGRVRLGIAVATLKSGQTDAAKSALRDLANDVNAPKPHRAEAAYHLASLAAAADAPAEVAQLVEQINAIDGTSVWAQRAMALRQRVGPAPAAATPGEPTGTTPPATPATGDAAPAVTFPGPKS